MNPPLRTPAFADVYIPDISSELVFIRHDTALADIEGAVIECLIVHHLYPAFETDILQHHAPLECTIAYNTDIVRYVYVRQFRAIKERARLYLVYEGIEADTLQVMAT